jgi:hypothetical protein
MISTSSSNSLSKRRQDKLQGLFESRFKMALFALVLEGLIIIPLLQSFLFVVAVFNIPAVLALLVCMLHPQKVSFQVQKTTKFLLKIGVAKAVGGILLAILAALKYMTIQNTSDSNMKTLMSFCIIYLGGSALVDVIYSTFAFMTIKKTKKIIRILKRKTRRVKPAPYELESSRSSEASSSDTCSEDAGSVCGSRTSV